MLQILPSPLFTMLARMFNCGLHARLLVHLLGPVGTSTNLVAVWHAAALCDAQAAIVSGLFRGKQAACRAAGKFAHHFRACWT